MQQEVGRIESIAQAPVPDCPVARPSVQIVSHDPVTRVSQMHAQLMGAARFRTEFNEGNMAAVGERAVLCRGRRA